jgi:hypothetical protein
MHPASLEFFTSIYLVSCLGQQRRRMILGGAVARIPHHIPIQIIETLQVGKTTPSTRSSMQTPVIH